jgi:succinate dehydrogenase / fumarate reductase cytochrome b subunit
MTTTAMRFYDTSVGKKVVMAVSGFILFGFVLVHMIGNLQIFAGPARLNAYSAFLHGLGGGLWAFRGVLVLAVVLHMLAAAQLTWQAWESRPQKYRMQRYRETGYAARTMRWGGPLIAAFVTLHILHLTTGHLHGSFVKGDVYANVVAGFKVWWISALYIVTMLALGLHLFHGFWSFLQTLGANHEKYNHWRKNGAAFFAAVITCANVSYPTAVLLGLVK